MPACIPIRLNSYDESVRPNEIRERMDFGAGARSDVNSNAARCRLTPA